MKRATLLVGLAMAAVYLLLVLWIGPTISGLAEGAPLPDMRAQGYSGLAAVALIDELGRDGRSLYMTLWFPFDMAFLLLLTAFFGLALALLLPGRDPLLRALLLALPLTYGLTDAMENLMLFAAMQYGPEQLQPGVLDFASFLTRAKFAIFLLCVLMLVGAALHRLILPRLRGARG